MRVSYAIVFVSDMHRAVCFYRDVLGLPLKFESPGWTEFVTDGATLALHASDVSRAERDDPHRVPPGRCRPGLSVANLHEFHNKMVEKKGSSPERVGKSYSSVGLSGPFFRGFRHFLGQGNLT